MIFEELVETEKTLVDLKKKSDLKKNKTLQENTDTKYRIVLKQTEKYIDILEYLYGEMQIQKDLEMINNVSGFIDDLDKTISTGLAIQEDVLRLEQLFKTMQLERKKEWSQAYSNITGTTVSTLEAIKGIDSDSVEKCLKKIQSASVWELNLDQYKTLKSGLNEADQLIGSLGLDDEIVEFLQRANSGKATLSDLTEKVLLWIRDENLENKIRISFLKKIEVSH